MKFSTPVGFRSMMCRCSLSFLVCMNVHVGVCNSCEVIFILYQTRLVGVSCARVDAQSLLVSSTGLLYSAGC